VKKPFCAEEIQDEACCVPLLWESVSKINRNSARDQVTPERVVAFDFVGWGGSDKPAGYPYTARNQTGDLDAVIEHLRLARMVLVAHDASGPPVIDLGPRPSGSGGLPGAAEHLLLPHAGAAAPT